MEQRFPRREVPLLQQVRHDRGSGELFDGALGEWIELAQRFDGIPCELTSHRVLAHEGIDVHDPPPHRELSGNGDECRAPEPEPRHRLEQEVVSRLYSLSDREHACTQRPLTGNALQQSGCMCHHNPGLSPEQGTQRLHILHGTVVGVLSARARREEPHVGRRDQETQVFAQTLGRLPLHRHRQHRQRRALAERSQQQRRERAGNAGHRDGVSGFLPPERGHKSRERSAFPHDMECLIVHARSNAFHPAAG